MDRESAFVAAALKIQEAALVPENWPGALEQVGSMVGAKCAGLFIHDLQTGVPLAVENWNIDPTPLTDYAEYYHKVDDLLFAAMRFPQGQVACGQEVLPREKYLKSEHYNDFWKPQGLSDILTIFPLRTDRYYSHFGFFYRDEVTDPSGVHRRILKNLLPFVQTSIACQLQLSALKLQAQTMASAFDCLAIGVIVLGYDGRVLEANCKAREILARHDGLISLNGRLRAARNDEAARLTAACRRATRAGADLRVGQDLSISRIQGKRPYHLTLVPLPDRSTRRIGWLAPLGPKAIGFLRDGDDVAVAPQDYLTAAYGLTVSEANVVVGLAEGRSLKDQAECSRRAYETLRAHLKSAMTKTDTHSQAALVRLAVTAAARLPSSKDDESGEIGKLDALGETGEM